jgi:cytochrome c oxidase cbb3-type subunit III
MRVFTRRRRSFGPRRHRVVSVAAGALLMLLVASSSLRAQEAPETAANDLAHGKRVFEGQCARCHGIQGTGGTGANLARPVLRNAASDEDLLAIIEEGIPGTAMPGNWFLSETEIRDVARYVRSLGRTQLEPLPGDAERGRKVFAKNNCAKCHIVDGVGGSLGPDLTDVGARRGLNFLRGAVVHPGEETPLDEQGYAAYLAVVAVTADGRVLTGTRINEDTFTIQLRDEKNRIHSLAKSDLEALRKTGVSMMPAYEQLLSPDDVNHLISYLAGLQGGAP